MYMLGGGGGGVKVKTIFSKSTALIYIVKYYFDGFYLSKLVTLQFLRKKHVSKYKI